MIINSTSDEKTYAGSVVVPALASFEVPWPKWAGLLLDPDFVLDLRLRNITVSDGKQVYGQNDEELFFARILRQDDRVQITKWIENVVLGAGTQIHAITNGKTFYLTGYELSAVNTSGTVGRFCLQHGANTNQRISFILPQQPIGGQAGAIQSAKKFDDVLIPFTTDVRAIGLAGTVTASITLFGFET